MCESVCVCVCVCVCVYQKQSTERTREGDEEPHDCSAVLSSLLSPSSLSLCPRTFGSVVSTCSVNVDPLRPTAASTMFALTAQALRGSPRDSSSTSTGAARSAPLCARAAMALARQRGRERERGAREERKTRKKESGRWPVNHPTEANGR